MPDLIEHLLRVAAVARRIREVGPFDPDTSQDLDFALRGLDGIHSKDPECPVCDGCCAAMPSKDERLAANSALFAAWREYAGLAHHSEDDQATRRILCGVALKKTVRSCGSLEPDERRRCAEWFNQQSELLRLEKHAPRAAA